ncbi:interferon-induced very large GTPase 1 isoform X1 [Pleuronectes platessa]|uniref:interferon-induced very large GTPase 1 isoform X1 n=2 Tax=Pleuronectes platessa TaxID=8262 RepID=UPI00232A5271|nr:interferon-induced very large GTPase 1 isoform X1 [Pleuronectes platessa]
MSVKFPKRLSSKRRKPPKDNAQAELLHNLGLDVFWNAPLDPASMLDINTWNLENKAPLAFKDLPSAFLRRLWLLSQDARSPCCKPSSDALTSLDTSPETLNGGESQCAINPLDLVSAVFMSANPFLQQEMTVHMVQCQFAVPLVLPSVDPEEASRFLLWPLRGVVSHLLGKNGKLQEVNLASTYMPILSCVKLGHCNVSKSKVLNHIISGPKSCNDTFLHRGMDGGQLPRTLSNGLLEIGWHLPTGDTARDGFPVPVAISNLRGEASKHEGCLNLLCQASSAMIVFCGNLKEKDKQLLASCRDMASKLILIDISDTEKNEHSVVGFVGVNLEQDMGLPEGSVLQGEGLSEEELADRINVILKDLLPDKLKLVTLEAAADLAVELGLNVDEGTVCKKAMAKVEKVLEGLEEGSAQFREKQLPLQGPWWSKLAEMEKMESKQRKEGKQNDPQLQNEKRDILAELKNYKITSAMKTFTDALFTIDKVERTYFLKWMELRLQSKQTEKQNIQQDPSTNLQTDKNNGMLEYSDYLTHGADGDLEDSDSFCSESTFEEEDSEEQPVDVELQVSDQPCDNGQDLSSYGDIEPHSVSRLDPIKEEQFDLISNGKEIQGGQIVSTSHSFDEQISDSVLENQNCHLESRENGALSCHGTPQYEPELRPATPDSYSSTKQQMSPDVSVEPQLAWCLQTFEPDPFSLGLEHFLREMGLIFELTHNSRSSRNQKVSRLPSLAVDLLFYGVPLELMDGDASNIPTRWLGSIFAELKRRLPQEQCKTRVLTNLGVHHARNAEVLSSVFGVKFPEGGKRSTRGVYMGALRLPDALRMDMECDFLLLIDVEGLCPASQDNKTKIHDHEMATVAAGLSNVLIQNIASDASSELETDIAFIVNALLRVKECGSMPNCQLLVQDEGINTLLQASQLKRVSEMLQTETGDRGTLIAEQPNTKNICCITCVQGPWSNVSLSEPVETQYSEAVLVLKKNLFGALKKSTATGLSEFMIKLSAIWDAVKEESFSIGLQNTEIALAFSLLCTKFSQWETSFLEHMQSWIMGAGKKIFATKEKALDAGIQNNLLNELKAEGRVEVKTEVDKLRSQAEAYLTKDDVLKERTETFKPILMSNMVDLQERVTEEITQRLATVGESHCSSIQVKKFETVLEKEQESKLRALVENSISTKLLLQDEQLEEDFEGVWSNLLSSFDFRPSETDDITARVTEVLRLNLISRGLLKHILKIEGIGQNETSSFQVYDEHFGYRSRLKHMFEDNNRQQRVEAQQVACSVIKEYNHFVAEKSLLPADFSDSYITEMLVSVEKALKEKCMAIKSAFEVDLKVYLCRLACQDFQKVHDRFAKDTELLTFITATKSSYLPKFIYRFRKRDQCQRVAQAFTSMIIKPTVLDYIYRPLGLRIVEEIQAKEQQYQSSCAFSQHLLEQLIHEDRFESFLEYLLSCDSFRLSKIQETVVAHLSESPNSDKWRQQRLGEIVGKVAAAVSETAEGTNGVLSDTKPLLERVCLILESDGNVQVTRVSLDGPLFSITTEWDRFVTCLMELLAAMRLELAQEFCQTVDVTQLLHCLPIQPHYSLLDRVRGCEKQCPLCSAPCEVQEKGHEVHSALLHRPKDLLPSVSCRPESVILSIPGQNEDTQNPSVACNDLLSLCPDWNIYPEDPDTQMPTAYWRYVLVRYNEKFAKEYEREPANIPEEWKMITEEEALHSLREAFLNKKY